MGAVRFIAAERARAPKPWHLGPFTHPFHELITVYHGAQRSVLDAKETFDVGPGDVILYRPKVAHEETSTKHPFESVWLAFDWDDAPGNVEITSHDATGRIRQLMTWLSREKSHITGEAARARNAYVTAVIAEHLDAARRPPGHDIVRRIRGVVREHIAEPLQLADLAREAGMSKYHFLRTYKALTGVTPMADVRSIRLERAREMVVATDLPLKAIAMAAGLGTASFLCRLFRSTYGVTPSSLRKYSDER